MKWHTVFGAQLFEHTTSELDAMSRDIALNHHEKWGGGGYPGCIADLRSEQVVIGEPKQGEEIPFAARITALADVYDALASRRSYKEAWSDDKIWGVIEAGAGTHFDPELVEAFFQITHVIKAIHDRYQDAASEA